MILSIERKKLALLLNKQLTNFFLSVDLSKIEDCLEEALTRSENCFLESANSYYAISDDTYFNTNHTGQYTIFLYYLSNTIYKRYGALDLADQIYYLNKIMNSVDWYYQIDLPEHMDVIHPMGSVLGRAKYSDKLIIYQGVTVGGNLNLQYPEIGENVVLFSNVRILGNTKIGKNVIVSAGTQIMDEQIPDNCLVFNTNNNRNKLKIVIKDELYIRDKLKIFWKSRGIS